MTIVLTVWTEVSVTWRGKAFPKAPICPTEFPLRWPLLNGAYPWINIVHVCVREGEDLPSKV